MHDGELGALRGLQARVPTEASEEDRELADAARDTIVSVMLGQVHPAHSHSRLLAAKYVREEICGPIAQKLVHTGPDGNAPVVEFKVILGPPEQPKLIEGESERNGTDSV